MVTEGYRCSLELSWTCFVLQNSPKVGHIHIWPNNGLQSIWLPLQIKW